MAIGKLWSVTLDRAEPLPLADFWAKALDGTMAYTSANFIGVDAPRGLWIGA